MGQAVRAVEPALWARLNNRSAPAAWLLRHEQRVVPLLLALVSWTTQFHHFGQLGLYEDDYWFIAQAMGRDPSYLASRAAVLVHWPQGRPLGFFVPDVLSFIGDKVGGLGAIYLLGFVVVVLNSYLCYRLLRLRMPPAIALIGATVFCLFPADTTKILLTHDFQLQPSLTFLLLASLAYARGRPVLAYVLSFGSLLFYESGFLPFFGIPLFLLGVNRRGVLATLRHTAVLLLIFVGVLAIRLAVSDERATATVSGVADVVPKIVASLVIGPARVIALFGYGPLKALPTWDAETIVLMLGLFVVAAWLVYGWLRSEEDQTTWRTIGEVAASGLVLLALAYGLAFTHFPPTAVNGRGTSVHLGATLGAAILFASGAWAVQQLFKARVASLVVAAYLALAGGYAMSIERDFAASWQLQQRFWQDVAACCSDLQDGTVLLYEWDGAPPGLFIFANSWADPLVLDRMFSFPDTWQTRPRLFSLSDWQDRLQWNGSAWQWLVPAATWDEHWEPLAEQNVILLRRDGDRLTRVTAPLTVAGRTFQLKPPAPANPEVGHGPLWPYLVPPGR